MFKPKTYRRNDLEVYRLIDAAGEEVFYEGKVDFKGDRLYSDDQGKVYYLAVGVLDPVKTYYVEVSAVAAPLPIVPETKKEKDIVGLLMSSPRDSAELPSGVFEATSGPKPAIEQPAIAEEPVEAAEAPLPPVPEEEDEEEHVIHEPYIDQLLKENLEQEPEAYEEVEAVETVEEAPEPIPEKRRRRIPIPLIAAALIVIVFIAIAGVYVVKPDLLLGGAAIPSASPTIVPTPLPSLSPSPSLTPTPSATPTPKPSVTPSISATPAVSPTPPVMTNEEMLKVSTLISMTDPGIKSTAEETVSPTAMTAGNRVWMGCDLYDYLDDNWAVESSDSTPETAPVLISTLQGTDMEYSAVYCSLAGSLGLETRVIIVIDGSRAYYYPEFKLASSVADRDAALTFIQNRYHCPTPSGHQVGNDFWISLVPGGYPGITLTGSSEYSVTPGGTITKIK